MTDSTLAAKATENVTKRPSPWRWARRILLSLALLATLAGILYTVENWRGRHAWSRYRHEAELRGRTFDWQALIPPPVPDDQNVFKAPKMTEWFVRDSFEGTRADKSPFSFPPITSGDSHPLLAEIMVVPPGTQHGPGETNLVLQLDDPHADVEVLRILEDVVGPCIEGARGDVLLTRRLPEAIKPAQFFLEASNVPTGAALAALLRTNAAAPGPMRARDIDIKAAGSNSFTVTLRTPLMAASAYLKQSGVVTTNFDMLRNALERPYARMEGDSRPFGRPMPNFVQIRVAAQGLAERAEAEVLVGESQEAWHDLSLVRELCRLLQSDKPMTLVAGMIEVAITGLYTQVIQDGLRLGAWREPELAAIEKQLAEIRLPGVLATALDFERVAVSELIENSTRAERAKLFGSDPRNFRDRLRHADTLLFELAPRGWLYQNMVAGDLVVEKMTAAIDATNGIVRPGEVESAKGAAIKSFDHPGPYTFLAKRAWPNFIRAVQTTAHNQALVNEAIVACGLERFRLARGAYPQTIEELSPEFVKQLPHDVVNGEPLKYGRTAGGGYLLYSIGWNEKDDGGKSAKTFEEGDWVWDNKKAAGVL
jgi:hypothetical protein